MIPALRARMSSLHVCSLTRFPASLADESEERSNGKYSMPTVEEKQDLISLIASTAFDSVRAAKKGLCGLCFAN